MDTTKLLASELSYEDQARLLYLFLSHELASITDIVTWAEGIVDKSDHPPTWATQLYTLNSRDVSDYARFFREHFREPQETKELSEEARLLRKQFSTTEESTASLVRLLIKADAANSLPFAEFLSFLWQLLFYQHYNLGETSKTESDILEQLRDLLVEWDCLEDPSVVPETIEKSIKRLLSELA
jgi:hypothetical protein